MSEVVRDRVDHVDAAFNGSFDHKNPVLDYPIVPCGDSSVVLAVDRDELAEAVGRVPIGTNIMGEGIPLLPEQADAVVDAILGELRFREVEAVGVIHDNGVGDPTHYFYSGSVDEGNYRVIEAYDIGEVALLKPSPTSKERERP